MDKTQIWLIKSLLEDVSLTSEAAIKARFDNGKKADELTNAETNHLIAWLKQVQQEKIKKPRNKIYHLLCLMGMEDEAGKIDFKRQHAFVQKIGTNNPKQKKIGQLSLKEVLAVLTQVEAMVKKDIEKKSGSTGSPTTK